MSTSSIDSYEENFRGGSSLVVHDLIEEDLFLKLSEETMAMRYIDASSIMKHLPVRMVKKQCYVLQDIFTWMGIWYGFYYILISRQCR